MSVHDFGNPIHGGALMLAATVARELPTIARALVARQSDRDGTPRPAARKALARRLRIPAGTIENLERDRSKLIRADHATILFGAEIAALEARLNELRAIAAHPLSPDFQRAEAALAEARKAMGIA